MEKEIKGKSPLMAATFLLLTTSAHAAVHTWHDIKSEHGRWQGGLSILSADQKGYFTSKTGTELGTVHDFQIDTTSNFSYGFGFDYRKTDFNVAYSITLYEPDYFINQASVFTVTAIGPGQPDIRINAFNGVDCQIQRGASQGTNFFFK